ncbi:protein ULTRAPETALA 1-like [Juglans regia]|uniref:Protein ULTRAPETALA 1-like n=1 Tax=Juglans regia TaxID=51240 RepID=A0A2I4H4Z3_JUGRE|nr:protein ULTRAPETALA 1-like [Juglans regia]
MLNEEELNDMSELDRGPRFLEVKCDCTNRKYGDFTGRLRISTCGHVVIAAWDRVQPQLSGRTTKRLLSRSRSVYPSTTKMHQIYMNICSTDSKSSERERKFHRDEFIKCSTCNKERMTFRLRNREQRPILCLFRLPQVPLWTLTAAHVPVKSRKAYLNKWGATQHFKYLIKCPT